MSNTLLTEVNSPPSNTSLQQVTTEEDSASLLWRCSKCVTLVAHISVIINAISDKSQNHLICDRAMLSPDHQQMCLMFLCVLTSSNIRDTRELG